MADHRFARAPSAIGQFALAVLAELVSAHRLVPEGLPDELRERLTRARATGPDAARIRAIAKDLARAKGRALGLVGPRQPAAVHVVGHLLHAALGSRVAWTLASSRLDLRDDVQDLSSLARELDAGAVDTLVVIGGNPARTAPRDLAFGAGARRAKESVYL